MSPDGWQLRGEAACAEAARAAAERQLADTVEVRLACELAGHPAFFKANRIPRRAGRRHAWRARLLGKPYPALAELASLEVLRSAGLRAPRPLAAGVLLERGTPTRQFLATEWIAGARSLHEVLRAAGPERRADLHAGPARFLARLHGLGLVHRNPFPRNWVVAEARLHLLDAWRLGRVRPGRGAAYDLACLLLEASPAERAAALAAYAEARGGPPAATWERRVAWYARGLARRARREEERRRARAQADDV